MNKNMKDHELILSAVDAFKGILPEIEIHPKLQKKEDQKEDCLDIIYRNKKYEFEILVKRNIAAAGGTLNSLVKKSSLTNKKTETILVTEFVSRNSAYLLKKNNVFFLDTVGNAHLKAGDMLIFLADKSKNKKAGTQRVKRAFYGSGLKIIFNLLLFPGLINRSYRIIADVSKVSLGSIGWIFQDLKEMGYIIEIDKREKKIINKDKLFEKWIEGYGEKLRPNLLKGRYRFALPDKARIKDPKEIFHSFPNTFLGGEIAAELFSGYLKSEMFTLYSADNILEIIKRLKLIPDNTGSIEILDLFWDPGYYRENTGFPVESNIVPVHLVYADLIISGHERNLEGAKYLYEKHLQSVLQ